MTGLTAVEFFSGIGAFAQACAGTNVRIIAAFDQSADVNRVYAINHGLEPSARNLDTIGAAEIPKADVWWMSPPCKPYTRRGNRQDEADSRARSLGRLIELLPEHQPQVFMLENVAAFEGSRMHSRLMAQLATLGYASTGVHLCPTQFGIPMRRPRFFVIAARSTLPDKLPNAIDRTASRLRDFLQTDERPELLLSAENIERYGDSFDIIDPNDDAAEAICFTSGYHKCMKASGSYVRTTSGIRRFSPREMLKLFGFPHSFAMPEDLPLACQWRLIGNSVHIACIRHLLQYAGIACGADPCLTPD